MSKGTNIWLVKDEHNRFHPFTDLDYEKVQKIPVGEDNLFVVKRVRNPQFHRKYFAMLKLGYENQDHYTNFDQFRKVMQMKAGYYEPVQTDKLMLYLPKSISYESMDEDAFRELYDKVYVIITELIGMNAEDKETFDSEIAKFA